MAKSIEFSERVLEQIKVFFSKKKKENILCVFGFEKESILFSDCVEFDENDYAFRKRRSVMLTARTLGNVIIESKRLNADIILLIHNHPFILPYFSKADVESFESLNRYLCEKNLGIKHGIAIVSGKKMKILIPESETVEVRI